MSNLIDILEDPYNYIIAHSPFAYIHRIDDENCLDRFDLDQKVIQQYISQYDINNYKGNFSIKYKDKYLYILYKGRILANLGCINLPESYYQLVDRIGTLLQQKKLKLTRFLLI